jgi:uncharacterized membrane protein
VYTLIVVLHVVLAVFIIGPMAILPMTGLRALRSGQGEQVATLATSTYVLTALSLVVALLGFAAVGLAPDSWDLSVTTPWVLASIIVYVVAALLDLLVVVPAMRVAAADLAALTASGGGAGPLLATEGGGAPAEGLADAADATTKPVGYARIAATSGVVSVLLVVVTVLMVWRPGS